ncbi:LRRCC1 [Symbiodinium sp. CCMP2592]|nr:LRRCC1 [Symbiodinium sp. CCMP2592]
MAGDRPELRLIRAGLRSLADAGVRAPEASRLRALHLHGNALVSLQGLDAVCPALEELVASSNDLRKLQGLAGLQRLRLLDVSCNCLRSLEGLEGLRHLEELRAAYNQISSLQALLPLRGAGSQVRFLDLRDNAIEHLGELLFLGGLHNLQDLRLQSAGGRRANPVCRLPGYRSQVLRAAPDLQLLDEEAPGAEERFADLERAVLPETWPPARAGDTEVPTVQKPGDGPLEESEEATQANLARLRVAVLQKQQAAAEARSRRQASEESLAALLADAVPNAPKIGRQLQQELRIVAGEAKRRQAMNAELKTKLSETLRGMQQLEASARQAEEEVYTARRACQRVRERRFKAAAEAESFASAVQSAVRRREEEGAELAQEREMAERLLVELTEKTEALAADSAELRMRSAAAAGRQVEFWRQEEEMSVLADQAEEVRQELSSRENGTEEWRARCREEGEEADVLRHLRQEAAANSTSRLEREEELVEHHRTSIRTAETAAQSQKGRVAEMRQRLESDIAAQNEELEALARQSKARRSEEAASAASAEQHFATRRRALANETRALQDSFNAALAAAESEEKALRCQRQRAEACHADESSLHAALASELVLARQSQGALREAEEELSCKRAEVNLVEARQLGLRRQQAVAEAELQEQYVEPSLLEAVESQFASLTQQRSELQASVARNREEESRAEEALASAQSPGRLQEELLQEQARMEALQAEFHDADQQMDLLSSALQELQEEATTRDTARAKRQSDWRKAEAQVLGRLADASSQEEAAQEMAGALMEELDTLNQESSQFDEDFLWLEGRVDEAREQWSLADEAEAAELAAVETRSMRSAEEMEHQLASLSRALARELQKRGEVNRKVQLEIQHDQELLEGYQREEAAVQEVWNAERQGLAEEAAAMASELQRLASGLA